MQHMSHYLCIRIKVCSSVGQDLLQHDISLCQLYDYHYFTFNYQLYWCNLIDNRHNHILFGIRYHHSGKNLLLHQLIKRSSKHNVQKLTFLLH
jgi:hypothetical protein